MINENGDVILSVSDLHAEVDGTEILKGLNLQVKAGEIHAVMGLNGSGKSTLSKVLAGHPEYQVTHGDVIFQGQTLLELEAHERSLAGIFLAFQYPLEIPGVSNLDFLRVAYNAQRKAKGLDEIDVFDFDDLIAEKLDVVKMDASFLERSVNEGFSGGEKKRNEILQMALLEPKLAILDETDSGLDIDALKTVAQGVNQLTTPDNAIVLITHYQRLLNYITPDYVHVMADGRIIKTGPKELALELEERGYDWVVGGRQDGGDGVMSIQTSGDRKLSSPTQTAVDRDAYLNQLLQQVSRHSFASSVLPKLGETATALVHEQSLPSTRDEDWRFTDLSALLQTPFAAASSQRPTISAEDLATVTLPETQNSRLVFVNGVYAPDLSAVSGLPEGVWVGGLIEGYADPALQSKIAQRLAQQPVSNEVFTALNTAGFQDAALIWVKRNQIVEQPIHVLFVSVDEGQPVIDQPRCLAIAEANSGLTLIEEYWGLDNPAHFTNGVTEIWLEENAQVNHSRIQRQGSAAIHIGKTAVSQARDSRYICNAVSLGANLSRHNLEIFQSGEQTNTRLYGLSAIAHTQLADTHSVMSLTKPHGSFEQLHKSIVDDRAHVVFNGKVFVPQAAQLTNASQLNRNLMLSSKARVDTKPQLEIVADNVKCAHGATVSQLEADEIFYLQSRGISQAQAQRLLIYGFAMEIIEKIPISSLKQTLTEKITEWTN